MKQYQCLMEQIRDEFGIEQGDRETETEYKARIVYSLLGRMAYSSLGDIQEDTEPASIVHFKRRIGAILSSYLEMYPELSSQLPSDSQELSKEIYDIFMKTGCIYHTNRRILNAAPVTAKAGEICFTRGMTLNKRQLVGGVGTYMPGAENIRNIRAIRPTEMFQLETMPLDDLWKQVIQQAKWSPFHNDTQMEFLRTTQPYKSGYWVDKPDQNNCISLMRTKLLEPRLYYLFRLENKQMTVSPLPDWMVAEHRYRSISNACLFSLGSLPAAHYENNGAIVHLHLKYLYPPAELNLIRLYSWPMRYNDFPSNFHRILSQEVFCAIRDVLEPIGYQFVEG